MRYQFAQQIKEIKDVNKANEVAKAFAEKHGQSISVSASAGFGPFSASVGYTKNHERMDTGFFRNVDELKEFKEQHTRTDGEKVEVVARGIKLIEVSKFKSGISLTAEMVALQPVNQATFFERKSDTSKISLAFDQYKQQLLDVTTKLEKLNARLDNVKLKEEVVWIGTPKGLMNGAIGNAEKKFPPIAAANKEHKQVLFTIPDNETIIGLWFTPDNRVSDLPKFHLIEAFRDKQDVGLIVWTMDDPTTEIFMKVRIHVLTIKKKE